jgi:urate oxidase
VDRPYGLIEASVRRDDAGDEAVAWRDVPGFC